MTEEQELFREKRRKNMLEGPILKVVLSVATPMIVAMLIDSIYNMTDTYFVSQLGTAATAAVGINDSLLHIIRSVSFTFGMGAASYISRLLGAKRNEEASRVGTTAFLTAITTLSIVALVAYIFMGPLVTLMGATESAKHYSIDYAKWILLSAPFTAGSTVLSQMLRAEGSTKMSMIGMLSGCLLNMALDPLFINVLGFEVAGAAIATSISKVVSFTVMLTPFLRKRTILEIKIKFFTPKKEIYFEIARMGIPTFLRSSMMSVSTIVMNNVAGGFGDYALAAVSVANKCTRLIGSAIMGLGQGFQPIAGYCWGAKRYKRVRHAFWTCCAIGSAAAAVLGIGLAFSAKSLVSVFTVSNDAEIIKIGSYMIITQCITMVPHVLGMIANGLYSALGRFVGATVLGLSRQVIFLIPCVIILSSVFGIYGLASSQAISDVLTFLLAALMVSKLFKYIKLIEAEHTIEDNEGQGLPDEADLKLQNIESEV